MNVKLKEAEKIKVLNSDDVYSIMQKILLRENKIERNKERFWTIGLDNGNRILFVELISVGGTIRTIIEPMQVYRVAVLKGATQLILVHNHPSGSVKPSDADKDMTDRLLQVGAIIDIQITDHLIISEKTYNSFADTNLLEAIKNSKKYIPDYQLKAAIRKEVEEAERKKGKLEREKQIAKMMKTKGYSIEEIMELTGLTKQAIQRIRTH